MAVNVSNEFHRTSTKPIDDSLVLTKLKMKTMNVNLMPEKYFAVCEDDGCFYLYDKSLIPSAETGKFVKLDESQTAMFIEALERANIASGEKLSIILGKIKRYFSDLQNVAFSGSYNDLTSKPTLGTASAKDSTNSVTENSTALVESGAVYDAINEAISYAVSSVYIPCGNKTISELTNSLLVESNIGHVYNITDSGVTTSYFVEGEGKPINIGDNVVIVNDNGSYKFDLLSGNIDLSNYVQTDDSRLSDSRTPKSHTHGNVTNDGKLQTNDISVANGDKLVVTDSSDGGKVARASVAFDGSTTNMFLNKKGEFKQVAYGDVSGTPTLGTAASKNSTNIVTSGSHDLVESGAVMAAINNAVSSVYKPSGDLTMADLTSALLVAENLGNVYNITDGGTTTNLFINGAGETILSGDKVVIVSDGNDYKFDKMSGAVDLSDYVKNDDARLSDSRNAADVSAWAKAPTKPSYSWSEIGEKPTFSGGNTTLDWNTESTIANVGGNDVKVTMPENPIDSLEIGGRNLLAMSRFTFSQATTSSFNRGLIAIYEGNGWIKVTGTLTAGSYNEIGAIYNTYIEEDSVAKESIFTATIEGGEGVLENGISIAIRQQYSGGTTYKTNTNVTANSSRQLDLTGVYVSRICLYANSALSGVVVNGRFRIKLEKGNKATDWTPAPEDMVSKDEVKDTYDDTSSNPISGKGVKAAIETLNVVSESVAANKTIASWSETNGKTNITTQDISITKSQVSDFSHSHGNITNNGTLQTNDVTIANDDKLVITDSSNSSKVARANTTFDGTTTNKALTPKGTFETFLQSHQSLSAYAPLNSPALTGTPTAPTATSGTNTTQIATTAFVQSAIDNLPKPMIMKGTVGTNGTKTWSNIGGASSENQGHTYKVITAHNTAPICKVGDLIVSNGSEWVVIPSGDESFTDTWRNIKVNGTEKLNNNIGNGGVDFINGTAITIAFNSEGNKISVSHNDTSNQSSVTNSGRTYIQSVTLDDMGHVTGLSSATESVTNTDRYVNNASFAHDSTNDNVKMTLTRAGSDSATVVANIPKVSSSSAGVVPKGASVSSQTQSTKFLREDGSWAAPSYTSTENLVSKNDTYVDDGIGYINGDEITTISGNAATASVADKWTTARTLTIGATGKSVNGSTNVTWNTTEINRVTLSSSMGGRVVIALCKLSDSGVDLNLGWAGNIYASRSGQDDFTQWANINIAAIKGLAYGFKYTLITSARNNYTEIAQSSGFRACRFQYTINGVKEWYGGVEFYNGWGNRKFDIDGIYTRSSFTPFIVQYATMSNSVATSTNDEIYNSIDFSNTSCVENGVAYKGTINGYTLSSNVNSGTTGYLAYYDSGTVIKAVETLKIDNQNLFFNAGNDGIYINGNAISYHDTNNTFKKTPIYFKKMDNNYTNVYVGINNTAPNYQLDVSGDIRSSNTLRGTNILVSNADAAYIRCENNNHHNSGSTTNLQVMLHSAVSGNHGVYSSGYWNGTSFINDDKWIVYRDTNGNINLNGNSNTATKLGTSSVGATNKPIYLNNGTPAECGIFPTLNTTGEIAITENSDLNTYITPGIYGTSGGYSFSTIAASLLNKPTFNGGFRMSVQYGGSDNKYIRQIIYCKNGETFSREGYLSNNVWTWFDWIKILTSSNISSYAPSLTGTNASGTWEINITGKVNGYTIGKSVPSDAVFTDHYDWTDITNKPTFFSGNYNDLSNKPTIPAAQVNSDWNAVSGKAQILNKPTIPTKISDLTNDSGFTNNVGTVTSVKVGTTSYNPSSGVVSLPAYPSVPTKVSDLTNDSGFTTNVGTITGITMNGVSKGTSGVVDLGTVLTSHQDISGKADKSATVSNVSYDTTNKKIRKTINGTTTDIVTSSNIVMDGGGYKVVPSAKWFVGTAITGTAASTSATISGSSTGDMYWNTSTNNVYLATASNTWKYVGLYSNIIKTGTYTFDKSGNVSPNNSSSIKTSVGFDLKMTQSEGVEVPSSAEALSTNFMTSLIGIRVEVQNKNTGAAGSSDQKYIGIYSKATGLNAYAGVFEGHVEITGSISGITSLSANTVTATSVYQTSDDRLKDYKEDFSFDISKIINIPIKHFEYRNDENKTKHIGTSAQSLEKILPELVNTNEEGFKSVEYSKLSLVAIDCIKQLQNKINELEKRIVELEKK